MLNTSINYMVQQQESDSLFARHKETVFNFLKTHPKSKMFDWEVIIHPDDMEEFIQVNKEIFK